LIVSSSPCIFLPSSLAVLDGLPERHAPHPYFFT
jgi:hypothetical protein